MDLNRSLPRIDSSNFSMVPRMDVPRATFDTQHGLKTTINADYLYPILVEEVLPGDVHRGKCTFVARLHDLFFPIMDNVTLETFFFFVPNRLTWTNWVKMMGERTNPSDSISYSTPYVTSDANGFVALTLHDYMGLPVVGQVTAGQDTRVNALPYRAYYFIWNEWFRDQNLQNSLTYNTNDTGAGTNDFVLQKRNKKPDYFTSCLPWPLKGGVDITVPMAGQARVTGLATSTTIDPTDGNPANAWETNVVGTAPSGWAGYLTANTANALYIRMAQATSLGVPAIYADLSTATGQTINALRLAFQTQRLLERDARGGTRYTEIIRNHFGVDPQDSRLQRPEYIGGGRTLINTQAIPQTSATGLTGGTRPLGSLGGQAVASDQHTFSYHAQEHGFIIGLVNVTGEVTYQQGVHKKWTRLTRYDYYWPAFAHLGEQAVLMDEIYHTGHNTNDAVVFGYQERWAELRYRNSQVTGLFRSTTAGNVDEWHLAEQFGSPPALNSTFIQQTTPMQRILVAGAAALNQQIMIDARFQIKSTRPIPMNSVPGMIDRF